MPRKTTPSLEDKYFAVAAAYAADPPHTVIRDVIDYGELVTAVGEYAARRLCNGKQEITRETAVILGAISGHSWQWWYDKQNKYTRFCMINTYICKLMPHGKSTLNVFFYWVDSGLCLDEAYKLAEASYSNNRRYNLLVKPYRVSYA